MVMLSFFRSQIPVCFFDGQEVRVAMIHAKRGLVRETRFPLAHESIASIFLKIKNDFGKRVRLVLAEQGVYTFSIPVTLEASLTRARMTQALKAYFPEEPESTAWDYRVLSEQEGASLVEVTEIKQDWYNLLLQAAGESGIIFESIVPESVALAHLIKSPKPAVFLSQRADGSVLITSCVQGEVLTSFFFKELPATSTITALLDFFQKKYSMVNKEALVIGADQKALEGTGWKTKTFDGVFDPLLGEGRAVHVRKDMKDLNISPSLPRLPWYRRWFGRSKPASVPVPAQSGFTLLEILIVVGIIAILATIIIVAIDPAERFRNARESRRLSDIQTLSSVVHQYLIDQKGKYPPGIDEKERQIGTAKSGCALQTDICQVGGSQDCVDLSETLHAYLSTIPEDPESGSSAYTHYTIQREKDGTRLMVRACDSSEKHVIQ